MRDPEKLVNDNDHPELKLLLMAAKFDGPAPPAGAKQRVRAAVITHMRARDDMRQSGVRRIGSVAGDQNMPVDVHKSMAPKPPRQERSWAPRVLAFFAIAAALAIVMLSMRPADVSYAEQSSWEESYRNIMQTRSEGPRSVLQPPGRYGYLGEVPPNKRPDGTEEHRASITVIEESAPMDESEINATLPEDSTPPRELMMKLKHRTHNSGTPQIMIRSSCIDPNDWQQNVELDYPTEAYNAGVSGGMQVVCSLNAEGSLSGCVAQRPPGFTAEDTGKVLMALNSWTLEQSLTDSIPRTRRCKIDVIFDLVKQPKKNLVNQSSKKGGWGF